jgi:hypothetical protein
MVFIVAPGDICHLVCIDLLNRSTKTIQKRLATRNPLLGGARLKFEAAGVSAPDQRVSRGPLIALPSVQSDLGFARSSLAWVVNA